MSKRANNRASTRCKKCTAINTRNWLAKKAGKTAPEFSGRMIMMRIRMHLAGQGLALCSQCKLVCASEAMAYKSQHRNVCKECNNAYQRAYLAKKGRRRDRRRARPRGWGDQRQSSNHSQLSEVKA
jgi:hypothetical protein